jgi:hypothetical protein
MPGEIPVPERTKHAGTLVGSAFTASEADSCGDRGVPDKLNDEPGYVRLPVEEGGRDLPDTAVFAPGRDRLAIVTPRMRSLGRFVLAGLDFLRKSATYDDYMAEQRELRSSILWGVSH